MTLSKYMFSLNVTLLCVVFSSGLLLVNYGSAVLYSKYCITSNLWNIIFLVGSPACQTITMVQSRTLEMYNTIWYSFAVALCSSMYGLLTWVVTPRRISSSSNSCKGLTWSKRV